LVHLRERGMLNYRGVPEVSEKKKLFKVREKSGNFISSQGKLIF